jgi:type I restriction enzyme M protein
MPATMPCKRAALEALSRDDLLQLVGAHGQLVSDRRKKDILVDALVASKKVQLDELLASLGRGPLKAVCRSLGLDDSGREKAIIIERILGNRRPEAQPSTKAATHAEPPREPSNQAVAGPRPEIQARAVARSGRLGEDLVRPCKSSH